MKHKLSDAFLDKHKPAPSGTRLTIWDTTPGFGCRITDTGHKSFFVMRRRAKERKGKPIRIVLGAYGPGLSTDDARAQAKKHLAALEEGVDPREAERLQREAGEQERANSFRAVADLYQKRRLQRLDRGLEFWRIIDRELLWPKDKSSSWREKPVTKITPDDVQERVEALLDAGKPEAARRLFETVRALFVWARGQRRYKLKELPTDEVDATGIIGKKTKRKVILKTKSSDDPLRALWRAADRLGYPGGPFVKLLVLTAVRRSEAANGHWSEVSLDGDEAAWTVPPERMKGDAAHVVPITAAIRNLLEELPRFEDGGFLFSTTAGRRPISGFSKIKKRLDDFMLEELRAMAAERGEDPSAVTLPEWTLHDIRRTTRTHLSAVEVPEGDVVRELILAHRRPELHQIYDQHSYFAEKRTALENWAARLKRIVDPPPPADVLKFPAARA